MERNELPAPSFRVTREPRGLRIDVPVQSGRFRTLLNFVWLGVWAAGEAAIIAFLLGGFGVPESVASVSLPIAGLFLAAYTAAGGIVLWRWLWCVGGRDTFRVTPDALLVRREICGIGPTRSFPLEKITSVRTDPLRYRVLYPSWSRMFLDPDGSEVVIVCAGRMYAYGKGLEEAEALDLVDLLQEEVDFKSRKQRIPGALPAFMARSGLNR